MKGDPIPVNTEGNGSNLKTLVFDEADAPMLRSALSIAVNTAMMSNGREAIGRLQFYKDQLTALSHPSVKLLNRDTDLCEIAIAGHTASTWSIHRIKEHEWSRSFRGVVTVGNRRFLSKGLIEDPQLSEIAEMIPQYLPLTCEKIEVVDVISSPWIVT